MKLYELYINEEYKYIDAHQDRLKFYMSFISGLFAAIIAGILNSTNKIDFISLLIGPVVIIVLSSFAKKSIHRQYNRFLETVTQRSKVEKLLGLTSPLIPETESESNWDKEPIIFERHLKSRSDFISSKDFVDKNVDKGYNKISKRLLFSVQVLAIVLLIILVNRILTL